MLWKADFASIFLKTFKNLKLLKQKFLLNKINEKEIDSMYLLKKNRNSRLLVGTWKNATWAIRFYEKFGFIIHSKDETNLLLKKYWKIPSKQIDNSIVLEKA